MGPEEADRIATATERIATALERIATLLDDFTTIDRMAERFQLSDVVASIDSIAGRIEGR